jgi:CRP/FNR family transcriptional regulator, anaerobic regulatory protein
MMCSAKDLTVVPQWEGEEGAGGGSLTEGAAGLRATLADVCHLLRTRVPSTLDAAQIVFPIRKLVAGRDLVRIGQPLESIYLVRSGSFKSVVTLPSGSEQVIGFPMTGDVIGLDAVCDRMHASTVVALEHSTVVAMPYQALLSLGAQSREMEELLLRATSRELLAQRQPLSNMSTVGAEVRVARFLLQLGARYEQLGYSGRRLQLRMTRRDIAAYLGLSLETVSRSFTALATMEYIRVNHRDLELVDTEALANGEGLSARALQLRNGRDAAARATATPQAQHAAARWLDPIAA